MSADAGRLPRRFRWLLPPLVASAFLTETKLVPFLRNNVTLFEVLGALLIAATLLAPAVRRPLQVHPVTRLVALVCLFAAVSLINIQPERLAFGGVQLVIICYLALFLVAIENLFTTYGVGPQYLLRLVVLALLVIGPWVIWAGVQSGGDIQEVGPFRNRAHMGSYMLTAMWLALAWTQWPGLRARQRLLGYGAVALSIYAVAVSGRRSVYLALFLGLAALAMGFLTARRGRRIANVVSVLFAGGVLFFVYGYLSEFLPKAAFFQERVHMIDDRLMEAVGVSEEQATEESFFALQKAGVRNAFTAHPLIGIGWGGFGKSHWSPTGHEVHSTPLRFLAEMGLVGIVLYVALMGAIGASAWRSFRRLRQSPYGATAFTLLVGYGSMCLSYLYNRHVTERTFWLLLAVLLAQDAFAAAWLRRARQVRASPAGAPARRAPGAGVLGPAGSAVATGR